MQHNVFYRVSTNPSGSADPNNKGQLRPCLVLRSNQVGEISGNHQSWSVAIACEGSLFLQQFTLVDAKCHASCDLYCFCILCIRLLETAELEQFLKDIEADPQQLHSFFEELWLGLEPNYFEKIMVGKGGS